MRLFQHRRTEMAYSLRQEEGSSGRRADVFLRHLAVARSPLRPSSGSVICDRLSIFHDASDGLFYWTQTSGLTLDFTCYQFSGSYLSLALALQDATRAEVERCGTALVSLDCISSRPLTTFVRLNVVAEGFQQTLHETVVIDRGNRSVAFDLDGMPNAAGTIGNLWVDVIFTEPRMSEISISDFSISPEALEV